jgi:hypothetical protein
MRLFGTILICIGSTALSYEVLLQDHGGSANAPPIVAPVPGNGGEVETTAWQTRRRRAEAGQWRVPARPHGEGAADYSAARLLANETTTDGWLATHAAWVTPAACATTSFARGDAQRGHDADLLFGAGHAFSGGNGVGEIAAVLHPVCVPRADGKRAPGDEPGGSSDRVDLHGRSEDAARTPQTERTPLGLQGIRSSPIHESRLALQALRARALRAHGRRFGRR